MQYYLLSVIIHINQYQKITFSECTAKGGIASGGCAMGFGTCCLFTQTTCGGTVENNCTHVQ
jgi:hypothetical protein